MSNQSAIRDPQSAIAVEYVPLELVEESPLNPRVHFDQAEHEELTASIREHGFTLSTLLVRPIPLGAQARPVDPTNEDGPWFLAHPVTGKGYALPHREHSVMSQWEAKVMAANTYAFRFEVVAGARRRRAALAAGVEMVPVIVRPMEDVELIKLALIENLQREQLSAVEEANGYQSLIDRGVGVNEIAKQIGKTAAHVARTLSLGRLTGEVRVAVEAGKLPKHTAYLIARIPNEDVREEAAAEVLHPLAGEGPMTYRQAEDLMQRKFMRALRGLPWEMTDAELMPERMDAKGRRTAGGACSDCPFNTLNQAEERPEGAHARHGSCLNIACFDAKRDLVWARFIQRETKPEANRRGMSREECEVIFDQNGKLNFGSSYVDIAEAVPSELLRPGVEPLPWKDLLEGSGIEVLVARDPSGKRRELCVRDLAKVAVVQGLRAEEKPSIFRGDEREERQSDRRMNADEHKDHTLKKKAAKDAEAKFSEELHAALRREIRQKVGAMGHAPPSLWRLAAQHELAACKAGDLAATSRGCAGFEELMAYTHSCEDIDALALFVELLVFADVPYADRTRLEPVAKAFGVDVKAIEARIAAAGEG